MHIIKQTNNYTLSQTQNPARRGKKIPLLAYEKGSMVTKRNTYPMGILARTASYLRQNTQGKFKFQRNNAKLDSIIK